MKYHLMLLALASMMASVNLCELGKDATQSKYDRFELFRKTKALDPTDPTVQLKQFQNLNFDETKQLIVVNVINGDSLLESYKSNYADEIETIKGQYSVKDGVVLNYKRGENGEFSFDDWSNGKKFESTLRSIDAELPNNFEEDYKKVLVDLNTLRRKMFNYQKGFSKEDFERIRLFDIHSYTSGGFYAQYVEEDRDNLSVSSDKKDGKETISVTIQCDSKELKYKIVNGKVADNKPRRKHGSHRK